MENLTTPDSIIEYLKDKVEQRIPIAPTVWLNAAQKLNVLLGNENDREAELFQSARKIMIAGIEEGKSVAESKARMEATDLYKEYNKQKAKISQIEEFIRLAKAQSRVRNEEYKAGSL